MKRNDGRRKRALRNDGEKNHGFLKAFLYGIAVVAVCMVCLCLALSAFFVAKDDSAGRVNVLSPVITAVSFVAGGFAAAKADTKNPLPTAVLCGAFGIALSFVLRFSLNVKIDNLNIILNAAIMILSSVIGAKLSGNEKKTVGKRRN